MTALDPVAISAVSLRIYPHLFAEWVSGGAWRTARHLTYISERIADAIVRKKTGVIVNAPPRHRKSWLTSWRVPEWYLEHFPQKRVILGCYGSAPAEYFGRFVRDGFEENRLLSTKVRPDVRAANDWQTTAGGGMLSLGVGGAVLSRGGDLIIVDDPHKNWEEAQSRVERDKVWDWFTTTLWSRREPGATVLIAMQRFHADDLCGRIMADPEIAQHFETIRLPALAEKGDPLGRLEGEPLDPERYAVPALQLIRTMNQFGWDAMYQQNPLAGKADRAYPNFVETPNINPRLQLSPSLPLQLCIDFNSNPCMHMVIGQYDPKTETFLRRWEIADPGIKRTGQAMDEFEKLMRKVGWQWPELRVYGDASGNNPNTVTTDTDYDVVIRKLRAMGIPYRMCIPRSNGAVKARLMAVNDAMRGVDGVARYFVHPDCKVLINDFKELQTDDDGQIDKEKRDLSHASDADGYCITWCRPIRVGASGEARVMA